MKRKVILAAAAVLVILLAGGLYYINDIYHAEGSVDEYMNASADVEVIKTDNGLFLDGPGNETALIFYPGAKVEYTSYLPMLSRLSDEGVDCFAVEMPLNLAILGKDSADNILRNYDYENYVIGGHSLGGVMAADYANRSDEIDAMILLASYSTQKIDKPVLSIYGSEDKVLDGEKYNESLPLISENLTEVIIDGGNHAQFGDYGVQSGDGQAKISAENQQKQSTDAVMAFVNGID